MAWDFKVERQLTPCDCNCSYILVSKFQDHDMIEIAFISSTLCGKYTGFLGWFRRVGKAIVGKPIYHAEIYLSKEQYIKFIEGAQVLLDE